MKKALLVALVLSLVVIFAGLASAHVLVVVGEGDNTKITTDRTIDDYKAELKALSGADKVGDVIQPERNNVKYLFVPLYKDGDLIGYGSWVNLIIYNHPEDMIAYVSPDGERIVKWKPLDANDHHPELKEEKYLSRFYNMTLDRDFDYDVDVISGSTYSTNAMFFEMKLMLLTAQKYILAAE